MRYILYGLVVLVALVIFIKACKLFKNDLLSLLVVVFLLLIFGSMTFKFINVNTIPDELQEVIDEVAEEVGSNEYVRVNSNDDIEILINNKWVNTSDIDVVSSFTDDITIEYNGQEVEIMDSGVVSAIKVLKRLGILK